MSMQMIPNKDIIQKVIEQLAITPFEIDVVTLTIYDRQRGQSGSNSIFKDSVLVLSKRDKMTMLANLIKHLGITKEDLLNPLG